MYKKILFMIGVSTSALSIEAGTRGAAILAKRAAVEAAAVEAEAAEADARVAPDAPTALAARGRAEAARERANAAASQLPTDGVAAEHRRRASVAFHGAEGHHARAAAGVPAPAPAPAAAVVDPDAAATRLQAAVRGHLGRKAAAAERRARPAAVPTDIPPRAATPPRRALPDLSARSVSISRLAGEPIPERATSPDLSTGLSPIPTGRIGRRASVRPATATAEVGSISGAGSSIEVLRSKVTEIEEFAAAIKAAVSDGDKVALTRHHKSIQAAYDAIKDSTSDDPAIMGLLSKARRTYESAMAANIAEDVPSPAARGGFNTHDVMRAGLASKFKGVHAARSSGASDDEAPKHKTPGKLDPTKGAGLAAILGRKAGGAVPAPKEGPAAAPGKLDAEERGAGLAAMFAKRSAGGAGDTSTADDPRAPTAAEKKLLAMGVATIDKLNLKRRAAGKPELAADASMTAPAGAGDASVGAPAPTDDNPHGFTAAEMKMLKMGIPEGAVLAKRKAAGGGIALPAPGGLRKVHAPAAVPARSEVPAKSVNPMMAELSKRIKARPGTVDGE